MGFDRVARFIERSVIEVAPLAFMRGRSLNDSIIILDEAQNTTVEQMKMILTRIGFGSKAVVTGDITLSVLPAGWLSGLSHVVQVLGAVEGVAYTFFDAHDVVRHPLVQRIVQAYESRGSLVMNAAVQLVELSVQRRVRGWSPSRRELALWASTAAGARAAGRELSLRVVGAAESRRLNARFRGRDKPTNVLSFPPPRLPRARGKALPLGDLVICARVLRAEARAQHKTLKAHWAHLIRAREALHSRGLRPRA